MIRGACKDKEQAQGLAAASTELHDAVRGLLMENLADAPPDLFGKLGPDTLLWKSEVDDKRISLRAADLGLVQFMVMPMMLRPRVQNAVAPAQAVSKVVPKAVPPPKRAPAVQ